VRVVSTALPILLDMGEVPEGSLHSPYGDANTVAIDCWHKLAEET
jgi:hypothetical protein